MQRNLRTFPTKIVSQEWTLVKQPTEKIRQYVSQTDSGIAESTSLARWFVRSLIHSWILISFFHYKSFTHYLFIYVFFPAFIYLLIYLASYLFTYLSVQCKVHKGQSDVISSIHVTFVKSIPRRTWDNKCVITLLCLSIASTTKITTCFTVRISSLR